MKEKEIELEDNKIIFEKLTVKEAEKVKGSGPVVSDEGDIKPCQLYCVI
jgi:hypothetical protein